MVILKSIKYEWKQATLAWGLVVPIAETATVPFFKIHILFFIYLFM